MTFQLGNIIFKYRILLLIILLFLIILSVIYLPRLKVNQNFDDYLPKGDPELAFYQDFTSKMGNDDDILILAIQNDPSIFEQQFLKEVEAFVASLDSLDHIMNSIDLLHIKRSVYIPGGGLYKIPFLNSDNPERFARDSAKIMLDNRFTNWLISSDAKTLMILLFVEPGIDSHQADNLIEQIDQTALDHHIVHWNKIGRIFWEVTYNRLANKELLKGFIISILLLCITMLWLFRSFKILLMTLSIYMLTGILQFGYMSFIGRELNAMSNLIPIILLIVAVSDIIHIIEKYRLRGELNESWNERIVSTMNDVGLSVFLTSVTTSIGFLTLSLSRVTSVRNFGFDMAFGILLTFFISLMLIPIFIQLLKIKIIFNNRTLERAWRIIFSWIFRLYSRHSLLVWIGVASIVALSLVFIFKIDQNNYILSSMPSESQLTKDVNHFDKNLGGARTIEFAVLPKNGLLINDPNSLKEIKKVHQHLLSLDYFGAVLSTASLYESMYSVISPSKIPVLPDNEQEVYETEIILQQEEKLFNISLVDSLREMGRITGRMTDLGRIESAKKRGDINEWIINHTDTSSIKFIATGSLQMTDKMHQNTVRNLFTGLLLAIVVISLLMSIIFKNFRLVVVTMLSNILPIIAVGALMPIMNIELRYGTSIIFAIGFVIAIDDTIHFMSNYRLYTLNKYTNKASIYLTLKHTGKAILITSIILFFAFISLIFSEFKDSYAVGALLSLMIIIALIIDLILVPVMLNSWISERNSIQKSDENKPDN